MTRRSDVVIIGAGISGLACARSLSLRNIDSTVLEKSLRIGGLIQTTRNAGYITEHAASMVLNFSTSVNDFLRQTGIDSNRVERKAVNQRYIIKNDRLQAIPNTISGIMFGKLFSTRTRLKLLTEPLRKKSHVDNESVADFIRRRVGQQVLDLAINPYVSAVLACDPEKACARSTLPRLKALEQKFGSFAAGILLKKILPGHRGVPQQAFSFNGGMQTLIDGLSADDSVNIQTGCLITDIEKLKQGWRIIYQTATGEVEIHTRHVIFSTPADITAKLMRRIQPDTATLLDRIEYAPISQIHLGFERSAFRQPLEGNGFLTPAHSSIALRGSLWMSNLLDGRAPQNKILTSNVIGGACQPGTVELDDHILVDKALSSLQQLLGLQQAPEMIRINRHHRGLPLYHGAYHQLTTAISRSVQTHHGLHIAANYLHGISVRDRIIQAAALSSHIARQMPQTKHNHLQLASVAMNSALQ